MIINRLHHRSTPAAWFGRANSEYRMTSKSNTGIVHSSAIDHKPKQGHSEFDGTNVAFQRNRIVMADKTPHRDTPQKPYFISIGNFLAVSYWIIEAYFDSVLIKDTSFTMRLFPSDPNELWMRGLVSMLFVGFGLYAHRVNARIRAAEKLNVDAAWLLKNALSKTIRGNFPICVYCKKIRDQDSHWIAPDRFISAQTEAEFSHGICNECQVRHQ